MDIAPLAPADFCTPAVRLSGKVDDAMYVAFRGQFDSASDQKLVH